MILVAAGVSVAVAWAAVRRSPASILAAVAVLTMALISPSAVAFGTILAIPVGVLAATAFFSSRLRRAR